MIKPKRYLGIDGGGTKTKVVLCDETGKVLQSYLSGASNHQSYAYNDGTLSKVLKHFEQEDIEVAIFTMSGWDFGYDQNLIKADIKSALSEHRISTNKIIIENDTYAVLKSGLGLNENGIVFIAGTGTMGAATINGSLHRHYGYGYMSGEWGGGAEISRYAMYRLFAAEQKREPACPILRNEVLRFFELDSIDLLVEQVTTGLIDDIEISKVIGSVFDAYKKGCETSKHILEKAGKEHAKSIKSLMQYSPHPCPIVLGGGIFQRYGIFPGTLEFLKDSSFEYTEIRIVHSDPVYGAIKWALEEDNIVSETVNSMIEYRTVERNITVI